MTKTKFATDLKKYFPELYQIYKHSKDEPKIIQVVETMVEMYDKKHYGKIEITYQQGKINHIYQTSNRE